MLQNLINYYMSSTLHFLSTKFLTKWINSFSFFIQVKSDDMPVPRGYTPSYQWQMQQAADFADLRQKIARFKARSNKNKSKQNEIPLVRNYSYNCYTLKYEFQF